MQPTDDPPREYDQDLDCMLSFEAAIRAIGERVRAGDPVPMTGYFQSTKGK